MMPRRFIAFFSVLIVFSFLLCQTTQPIYPDLERYSGLSFVAPPDPFSENPMVAVQAINANSISVIPYGFTRQGNPEVRYNISQWQWWGEKPEGIIETIRLAHQKGIKVMVKPQIYIPGSWTGELDFATSEDWSSWEASYQQYILDFALIADSMEAELFCIGTEFKISVDKRPEFWYQLIKKVQSVYRGKITYAANWDDFDLVPFWDKLDFIGVDAYFPLTNAVTPKVKDLVYQWQAHLDKIEKVTIESNRPILFTEYGYLSVDRCAHETWELEKVVKTLNTNEQAQANALEALYQVFHLKPYWKGGFLWKWFPNGAGHEGYIEKDYTPQNKLAHEVVRTWHEKM